MAAHYDFTLWRGNDGTIKVAPFGQGQTFDHTGSTWRLTSVNAAGTIVHDKTGAVGDDGFVTFAFTPAETRSIEIGVPLSYEIERRIGGAEQTYFAGKLIGAGGANADG